MYFVCIILLTDELYISVLKIYQHCNESQKSYYAFTSSSTHINVKFARKNQWLFSISVIPDYNVHSYMQCLFVYLVCDIIFLQFSLNGLNLVPFAVLSFHKALSTYSSHVHSLKLLILKYPLFQGFYFSNKFICF